MLALKCLTMVKHWTQKNERHGCRVSDLTIFNLKVQVLIYNQFVTLTGQVNI